MEKKSLDLIQANSPDGGFLQSAFWRKFQESYGRKIQILSAENDDDKLIAHANIITHSLPIVGNYFYIPRGPVMIYDHNVKFFLEKLVGLAKKNNIGWIRIEPSSEEIVDLVKNNLLENLEIKKSSVDMQSREILAMDISKSEEEILAEMKQKTRYNLRLAQKKNINVFVAQDQKYIDDFCQLVKTTAQRDKITSHPENYYRKMLENIPSKILKLYVAEYEGRVIAANLILFFGRTATYMHGASANEHRNLMSPYLLQWQTIKDAKKAGCKQYDFGGVDTKSEKWAGITKFKIGFSPETKPIQFPGCYDIILRSGKYNLYLLLQKIKRFF